MYYEYWYEFFSTILNFIVEGNKMKKVLSLGIIGALLFLGTPLAFAQASGATAAGAGPRRPPGGRSGLEPLPQRCQAQSGDAPGGTVNCGGLRPRAPSSA